MKRTPHRELYPELLASAGLNFAADCNSSARQEMFGSHLSQMLVIDGANNHRCMSGMERAFAKATFNIKFPCHAEIKAVVQKYPRTEGLEAIKVNPVTSIIYQNIEQGVIDVLDMPYFHCKHNHFGFRYKLTDASARIVVGNAIPKGTIIADSPNVDSYGNYHFGTELNVCFMSMPGIIEDGVIVSESATKKLTATGFEKRAGSWGRKRYPLNLYGSDTEFKAFPDIGDRVRDDGLLFAFREYDELLAGVEMANDSLQRVDHIFDRRVYAIPNAKVIDIVARRGAIGSGCRTPLGMDAQAQRYHDAQARYYDELMSVTQAIKRRGSSVVAPKLHRLLVEGLVFKNDLVKNRPHQMYNLQELDEWRIDITFEYKLHPNVGSKLTDIHGKHIAALVRKGHRTTL